MIESCRIAWPCRGGDAALASNPSGIGGASNSPPGRPRIGREIARGAEGIVYENLDQPDWVVKVFHPGRTSPLQAGNEFANLEKARAIRPDNVVKAQVPIDPRQGWIVKEKVLPTDVPEDVVQRNEVLRDLQVIPDVDGNLRWVLLRTTLRPGGYLSSRDILFHAVRRINNGHR